MNRRDVLALAAAPAAGIAGCLLDSPSDDGQSHDDSVDDPDRDSVDDSAADTEPTENSLEELEQEDILEFANFDPVVNEAFVGIVSDPPVDRIVLVSEVAGDETQVSPDEGHDIHSVPVDHEGDTLSVIVIANDSETVVYKEEWTPPTADDFEEEIIDKDNKAVENVKIIEQEMRYMARVNLASDIEASEIHIISTVAQGEFQTDTLDDLNSANVQINAVHDEVTITAISNGDEEIVHREHLQPS